MWMEMEVLSGAHIEIIVPDGFHGKSD